MKYLLSRRVAKVFCFSFCLSVMLPTQQHADELLRCGTRATTQRLSPLDDIGGKHITGRSMLRVLIVFASFPDDSTPHPFWPRHSPPQFMQQFIDPDTASRSQSPFNLTNYFRQMSLGQFHLVGEVVWVESAHSQDEYRTGAYGRANTDVLRERVDPIVDFTLYDRWTKEADFQHSNTPDGVVDMIVMVWRTNIFPFLGEASLGYRAGFVVDGKRIEMGFPEYLPLPVGSGVTCEYLYGDNPQKLMQTMTHELSHWLLGGAHPYNNESLHGKHIYWGMLCTAQRAASCVNAYERERLGWTTIPEIASDTDIALTDFLTTGAAYKYHPPNAEPFEYFYVENHQKLSVFDDATANPGDKGVWILHQQGPYMELDNLRIRPSDGNWHWENPATTTQCFAQPLPLFEKGTPNTGGGESHRDQIPNRTSAVNWLHAYRDRAGALHCGNFSFGELFAGALSQAGTSVFSAYSNPNSNTWNNQRTTFSLEVLDETNGIVSVRYNSNPLDASPARRYLGTNPTIQTREPERIYLAWGAQWNEGLEEDVNWSELQRKISDGGNWTSVYTGTSMSWDDGSIRYDSSGTIPVLFRARVRDTQGKYSTWSNIFYSSIIPTNGVALLHTDRPTSYALMNNYPNPFNPATTIGFSLPVKQRVTLAVFDIMGRLVATLHDGVEQPAGEFRVVWDGKMSNGSFASSGVYLYRMQAGSFRAMKKMVIVR